MTNKKQPGAQPKNKNAYKGREGKDRAIRLFPLDDENIAILKKAGYGKSHAKIIRKLIQDAVDLLLAA